MIEVYSALREMVPGTPVTRRLKRFETVAEKLRRMRTSGLSSFEDIAGCRVVLPTMTEQRQVLDRIRADFEIARERDYQTTPRDGYRAVHVVVRARGRPVEVQLRTELEDAWAVASETLAYRLDPAIKYGGGPVEVRAILSRASVLCGLLDEAMAASEAQRSPAASADYAVVVAAFKSLLEAIAAITPDVQS